jgi:CMP-N,N'-diacetyllegionaminic acid synthase
MKVLGIIPARGGSKGVKDKNIRLVGGQPLISHAIEAAQASKKLTHFIVNTDSEKIASVARDFGADVMMRPSELAEDNSSITSVIQYILKSPVCIQKEFDLIILLQPTSPIRTGTDIDNVIQMMEDDALVEGVISVVPMDDVHPARMYNTDASHWMTPFLAYGETAQRQDLPVVYYRNGCIYAVRVKAFKEQNSLMVKRKKAYVMKREQLANIDDERDLIIADVLVNLWKKGEL